MIAAAVVRARRAGPVGLVLATMVVLLALPPPRAMAGPGFDREIVYTRAAPGATVRAVRVTYDPSAADALTIGTARDIAATGGAAGVCVGPDGDLIVAGGVGAPNAVHKVRAATGAFVSASPGAGSPVALQAAIDPAGDKAWVACTVGSASRLARVPLSPFAQGVAFPVNGADTSVSHVCFGHGRAYYVTTGAAPGTGALGVIDLGTFVTTRLVSGLDRPRSACLDPHTGHVLVFGATTIWQVDARPGVASAAVSQLDLSGAVAGVDVCAGTADGLGHVLVLSATGHLVMIDLRATRQIGHAGNVVLARPLEAGGVLSGLVPLTGPGSLRDAACLWDSGVFDGRDGLPSHNSWMHGDTRTADDFYLGPGVHRVDSIGATMFTDSVFLTGLVEVYEDCDGAPGTLVGSFAASVTDTGEQFQGMRIVRVEAVTPGLWLRGGRSYWVSAVGIGSLDGSDNWYWGTAGGPGDDDPPGTPNRISGKPAVFRAPSQGVTEWTATDQAGCGCTDFAFVVRGETCKVLHDNGPRQAEGETPIVGGPAIISTTSSDARAADNFRVPPCEEDGGVHVCFVEAAVYTNCLPVRGVVEVFENDCAMPSGAALHAAPFSKVIDLGYNVVIAGTSLRAYLVQVHDPGWFLPHGRNYWVSVAVQGSGGFNQRAYFAATRGACGREACDVQVSQAAVKGPGVPSGNWTPIENYLQEARDLSFVVAVRDSTAGHGGESAPPPDSCIADADRNGAVEVTDIFAFLSAWFSGCP